MQVALYTSKELGCTVLRHYVPSFLSLLPSFLSHPWFIKWLQQLCSLQVQRTSVYRSCLYPLRGRHTPPIESVQPLLCFSQPTRCTSTLCQPEHESLQSICLHNSTACSSSVTYQLANTDAYLNSNGICKNQIQAVHLWPFVQCWRCKTDFRLAPLESFNPFLQLPSRNCLATSVRSILHQTSTIIT